MKEPNYTPTINLTSNNGNAFAILARVKNGLIKAGADKEYVRQYLEDARDGDYDHLLQVTMKYVNVE